MMLIDLRNKNITGKDAEKALVNADITANKNMVPFDDKSPFVTSGIRLGPLPSQHGACMEKRWPRLLIILTQYYRSPKMKRGNTVS